MATYRVEKVGSGFREGTLIERDDDGRGAMVCFRVERLTPELLASLERAGVIVSVPPPSAIAHPARRVSDSAESALRRRRDHLKLLA